MEEFSLLCGMETNKLIKIFTQPVAIDLPELISHIQDATAADISSSPYFIIKGTKVYPKEIEVYAYIDGIFPDDSVHRNELQQANRGHFYVHRSGKSKEAPYKGRAGVDYCFSNVPGLYYTWLIRGAYIEGKGFILGPSNFRQAILDIYGGNERAFESESFDIHYAGGNLPVLFSERINLGKSVSDEWRSVQFRAVLGDDMFRKERYQQKGNLIENYVRALIASGEWPREDCISRGEAILGYHMSSLQNI